LWDGGFKWLPLAFSNAAMFGIPPEEEDPYPNDGEFHEVDFGVVHGEGAGAEW